ncbi:retrovirus-related Pol polyprotein from transposon 297 [Trichonephila clavipes]|nr:retrovirus-related Pol polyprotein from transposon 297 [Trichonephila clavipes]
MFDPSSFVNPTPLAHANTSRDVLPRGGTSQWRPTRFNLYDPEMRNARGFNVWLEVISWVEPWIGTIIFGSTLVRNTATDFAQLKAALSKEFPNIQNRKDLETRFYASQQRPNQEPTDFVYDLLKLNKKLELGMSEQALVDHIFVRLEPQVQDCVEVRNPQTAIQLLEVLAKFEERYSCKATLGSRNSNNVEERGWYERRISNVGNNRGNWRNSEVVHRPNNARNDYRGNYQNNRQGNQWFESRNRFQNDDRRFNDRGYQFRNRGQNDDFSRGDQRNRGSSENFSRGSRKQMGGLNVLKVNDIKGGSKIILDFDRKSLAIPDSQINKVVKTVEIEKVEIDLSKTKLEERQKRELQDLFNSFQGLFSDKPGLTHVLYHEIDTGDSPPVVSRNYRYDRVKQEIIDYHVDKMLKEGTIIPIQSPYTSPVVLCRKNNGLHTTTPPDNPEAYRFAVDYRKLNAITKYPRYPLPLIDDLIMNIFHTGIMSALDLRSGYFQMAVNPSDIVKTAFVTKNGTYAFRRIPFGL